MLGAHSITSAGLAAHIYLAANFCDDPLGVYNILDTALELLFSPVANTSTHPYTCLPFISDEISSVSFHAHSLPDRCTAMTFFALSYVQCNYGCETKAHWLSAEIMESPVQRKRNFLY